jgi:hypothetical protein
MYFPTICRVDSVDFGYATINIVKSGKVEVED